MNILKYVYSFFVFTFPCLYLYFKVARYFGGLLSFSFVLIQVPTVVKIDKHFYQPLLCTDCNFLFCKGDEGEETKETSRDSDKKSATARVVTDQSKPADKPAPIPRAGSVSSLSKPIPKPRPRSLAVEQDINIGTDVSDSTERPIAPPRAKSKPPRGEIVEEAQQNPTIKAPKPEPPKRPDLHPPPSLKPKPKPVRSEQTVDPPQISASESNDVSVINDCDEDTVECDKPESQTKDPAKVGPLGGETKKAPPPPVPRRMDLE